MDTRQFDLSIAAPYKNTYSWYYTAKGSSFQQKYKQAGAEHGFGFCLLIW
jgi:hypothetical protein